MLIKEINNIILEHIPKSKNCIEYNNEPYGIYNIDLNSKKDIKKVLFCVTATDEVVKYFKKNKYDLLWQHHPYIIQNKDVPLVINHISLDDCIGGNNEIWRDHLGIKNYHHFKNALGWYGEIKPISFINLLNRVQCLSGSIMGPIYCQKGIKNVTSCSIVTGLTEIIIDKIIDSGVNVCIAGELYDIDRIKDYFKVIICVGHTRTEYIGSILLRNLFKDNLIIHNAPLNIDYFNEEEKIYENSVGV